MPNLLRTMNLRRDAENAAANFPALIARAEKAAAGILLGDHSQRKAGTGEKFWQYRDYVPGDRPQDIDWRMSAKSDRVFIRQKEWQTAQTAVFWTSQNPGMDFSSNKKMPTKAQAANILSMALAILMTRAGEQVGLYGHLRAGRTEISLQRIALSLSGEQKEFGALPDPFAYKLPRNCFLIQCGDFLSPPREIETVFSALSAQAHSGLVVQVLDPAEIDLPYAGRAVFEEPSARNRETVNHVDSIRAKYRDRIQDHLQAVENICRRQGWHYVLHRTDKAVEDTLSNIWAALHRDAVA